MIDMPYKTIHEAMSKARVALDALSALAHIFVVPFIVTVPFIWLTQGSTVTEISTANKTSVKAGESVGLDSTPLPRLHVSTDSRKVVSRMVLEDSKGNVVKDYETRMEGQTSEIRLSSQRVDIPSNLRPGMYSLILESEYAVNPLKTSVTRMEVAQIQVY